MAAVLFFFDGGVDWAGGVSVCGGGVTVGEAVVTAEVDAGEAIVLCVKVVDVVVDVVGSGDSWSARISKSQTLTT